MKKIILCTLLASFAAANCEIKIQKLERELEYAKQYNNYNKQRGIERALANVKAHCGYYNDRYYTNKYVYDNEMDYLEDEYESKIDKIEDELDALNDDKDTMSKAEYKKRKAELKAQKNQLKQEYKNKKRDAKRDYKYFY